MSGGRPPSLCPKKKKIDLNTYRKGNTVIRKKFKIYITPLLARNRNIYIYPFHRDLNFSPRLSNFSHEQDKINLPYPKKQKCYKHKIVWSICKIY